MLDLSDLGLTPVVSAATETPAIVASSTHGKALVPGSMKARLLYAAFSRQPVSIIDSPPGAGKTTLVVEALDVLLNRSDFTVVLATPTRRGAVDVAERLAKELGDDPKSPAVVMGLNNLPVTPPGCFQSAPAGRRFVLITTVASASLRREAIACDIMIVDEAYQTTFADVMSAADGADQIIMVGDPGQIGPVVTQNTSAWDGMRSAPHRRAPEVFALRSDALVLQMDATYRLGPETVEAIAPLYGFPFVSKRPERHLTSRNGDRLPELGSSLLDANEIAVSGGHHSLPMLKRVADVAIQMVGTYAHSIDAEGEVVTSRLTEKDVAVVVGHNVQSSAVQAMLRAECREGIAVGTADKMQGGEWRAVVVLDPLTGHDTVSPFQLALGRLCVMASRHSAAMVWMHDGRSIDKLKAAAEESPEALTGIAVRRALTANPVEFGQVTAA
jgi:hypothetical protein